MQQQTELEKKVDDLMAALVAHKSELQSCKRFFAWVVGAGVLAFAFIAFFAIGHFIGEIVQFCNRKGVWVC